MDKVQITIALSFMILFLSIGWLLIKAQKISGRHNIDDDLNINKNRLNWWRDKNMK